MELFDVNTWSWGNLHDQILDSTADIAKDIVKETSKEVAGIGSKKFKSRWDTFSWKEAENVYKANLRQNLNTTKVLGNPKSINIENIYTDVFVHDSISAKRHFASDINIDSELSINELQDRKRVPALDVVLDCQNLFILGRPGAGKTTFLKYLSILCCKERIKKTPIFVSLKEWSDSSLPMISFISKSFDICGFPKAEVFVHELLKSGKALVLLDGLDEVSENYQKRSQAIKEVDAISKKYSNSQYCLTCRTASTDYSFDTFSYFEVADFTIDQQEIFIKQWYGEDKECLNRFVDGWKEANQDGLRDISRTPLLLTLLCLAFDETLHFPVRQVDLYQEAIDALLKKWDSSRLIARDEFYKKLSPSRRQNLLEYIAVNFYFDAKVAFKRRELESFVEQYIKRLPDKEEPNLSDASTVIRQIENQHGLIVERAVGIYSFSHLTIQEYLTASYIVKNQNPKLLNNLATLGLSDSRWREVMLYTAGLIPRADELFKIMTDLLSKMKSSDQGALRFLVYNYCKVISSNDQITKKHTKIYRKLSPSDLEDAILNKINSSNQPQLTSAEMTRISENILKINDFIEKKEKKFNFGNISPLIKQCVITIEKEPIKSAKLLGGYFARPDEFVAYIYGCRLLTECLEVAVTGTRQEFLSQILEINLASISAVATEVGL